MDVTAAGGRIEAAFRLGRVLTDDRKGDDAPGARALARALIGELPHLRRRAMPGFSAEVRRVVDVWAPNPGPGGELTRLLQDMGRFTAGAWVTWLEATPGGLTLARMSDALRRSNLSGPGRARTILGYLRFIGFLEPAPEARNGREKHYRTTDRLRSAFRERLRREIEARRDADPVMPALLARFDDEGVSTAYIALLGEVSLLTMEAGGRDRNPVDTFSQRFSGVSILCEMLRGGRADDVFPPRGPVTFSIPDLARRCGASRMQVTSLLRQARKEGLLVPDGEGERFSEDLLSNFEALVAGATDMMVGGARLLLGGPPVLFPGDEAAGQGDHGARSSSAVSGCRPGRA